VGLEGSVYGINHPRSLLQDLELGIDPNKIRVTIRDHGGHDLDRLKFTYFYEVLEDDKDFLADTLNNA